MELKEQFLKKHSFTELDYRNLIRYEEVRADGEMNMFGYVWQMREYNINGGKRLADWIVKAGNYKEFLSTLGKEGLENDN